MQAIVVTIGWITGWVVVGAAVSTVAARIAGMDLSTLLDDADAFGPWVAGVIIWPVLVFILGPAMGVFAFMRWLLTRPSGIVKIGKEFRCPHCEKRVR